MVEKIYSEIKTLSEGHSYLTEKVEQIDKTVLQLESKAFATEMYTQSIKSQIGTIDIKTDRVEKELDTVKKATLENSKDIKEIKEKLDTATVDHERRLQKLEAVR